ncbi:MAG: hypothetical protein IJF15_04360 [Oscillospiraceae bacterium]|nr:hypothetical protein [Oscillospiraceae bacterium]
MAISNSFSGFTAARLGLYAAQYGLNLTSNNTSNINTHGYTRQVLQQESFRSGGTDMYSSPYSINIGNGVLTTGVNQIRDPYLDLRFRNENANVGSAEARLSTLDSLAAIFDEVGRGEGDGVIEKQLSDLMTQFQNYSFEAGQDEFDTLVRSSATTLAQLFNDYSSQLDDIEANLIDSFEQDIDTINGILSSIRDLSASIRKADIHGDPALELRDQRNLLIDELSKHMKIDVSYGVEDLGEGFKVEKLIIKIGSGEYATRPTLVDGVFATQLTVPRLENTDPDTADALPYLDKDGQPTANLDDAAYNEHYLITLEPLENPRGIVLEGSNEVEIADTQLYGSLQSKREMLTKQGEYSTTDDLTLDPDAAANRGISFYRHALNSLANKVANVFNALNVGYQVNENGFYTDADDNVLTHNGNNIDAKYLAGLDDATREAAMAVVEANGVQLGGLLFTNGTPDDGTEINAANISINKSWSNGTVRVQNSFIKPTGLPISSQDNTNILRMIMAFTDKQEYIAGDVFPDAEEQDSPYFRGTFQEMLSNISATLGNDTNITTTLLDNYTVAAVDLDASRDNVSGVDLNDEAANLMQYQSAYNAAARVITTIDEALDKLINGTGAVGR